MGQIVILSGPVGAGKSTVARELIAASGDGTAYIEGDTFWSFIAKPATGQSYPKAFTMIMRAMTATARHFERDGYEVLLDFSIPPWYLEAIGKLLQGKSFSYVVLRPSEEVCAARAAARPEGTIADYEPYAELYRAFDGMERHTLADDAATPAAMAARMREGLRAGAFVIDPAPQADRQAPRFPSSNRDFD